MEEHSIPYQNPKHSSLLSNTVYLHVPCIILNIKLSSVSLDQEPTGTVAGCTAQCGEFCHFSTQFVTGACSRAGLALSCSPGCPQSPDTPTSAPQVHISTVFNRAKGFSFSETWYHFFLLWIMIFFGVNSKNFLPSSSFQKIFSYFLFPEIFSLTVYI